MFENLKSSESTDDKAAVYLVELFPKLWAFGCYEENLNISSIINYTRQWSIKGDYDIYQKVVKVVVVPV